MHFESHHLYHVYNQGNNRRKIFLERENYLFFLRKIHKHVWPYADILAWCLMPNHFHLLVYVNHVELTPSELTPGPTSRELTPSPTQSRARSNQPNDEPMSFNKSIGILLASYTRAINKQQNWSGSLFRSETKAVCLTEVNGVSPAWRTNMGITEITVDDPDLDYPNVCFNYMLYNPVKDGLVKRPEDWEFSSYPDLIGIRNGKLMNKNRIQEFGLRIL